MASERGDEELCFGVQVNLRDDDVLYFSGHVVNEKRP
jgi:hypothetical protein